MLTATVLLYTVYSIYERGRKKIRDAEASKMELKRKLAEIEMMTLRTPVNPHFIFNTLNSINRHIVKSDRITASSYLTRFARLMRLMLDSSVAGIISLEQEIELLKLFAEMERQRFKNQFTYDFTITGNIQPASVIIPSMLFQPYLENAIWQGLQQKEETVHLDIGIIVSQDNLCVTIQSISAGHGHTSRPESRNSLQQKSNGMKITSERLQAMKELYGIVATLHTDDTNEPAGTRTTIQISLSNGLRKPGFPQNIKDYATGGIDRR